MTEAVPGCQGQVSLLVGGTDLAPALGSGSVPVLATWRIVALFEQAAHEAISASVGEESTTVARQVQIDHLSPVAEGAVVEAEAALERIEGRRLVFPAVPAQASGSSPRAGWCASWSTWNAS